MTETVQLSLMIIERLAGLCATSGIDTQTQDKANQIIQKLLDVINLETTTLSASSKGIIL